jgi:hypothetical protein
MFQFTKELIVNSAIFSANDAANILTVGGGTFKASEVVSCFKAPYVAPVNEKLVATVSVVAAPAKIYRLVVDLKRVDSYRSDYANDMSYNALNKIYEVSGITGAADLATAFVKAIKKESYLKDNIYIKASNTGAALTIEVVDEFQRIVKATISEVTAVTLTGFDSATVLQDLKATAVTASTFTKGVIGFGTVSHIVRNLRLPTLANTHYLAINQDERPVAGGQYSQYSIRLKTDRGPMGMNVVGQNVESITDHIFYVLSTQVAAWEAAITQSGIQIVNANTNVNVNDLAADLAND